MQFFFKFNSFDDRKKRDGRQQHWKWSEVICKPDRPAGGTVGS